MDSPQDQLRRGASAAGERLPTLEQCALQREDYEHEDRRLRAGPQPAGCRHIGGLIDIVMARVRRRTEIRNRDRKSRQSKEAQRGEDQDEHRAGGGRRAR